MDYEIRMRLIKNYRHSIKYLQSFCTSYINIYNEIQSIAQVNIDINSQEISTCQESIQTYREVFYDELCEDMCGYLGDLSYNCIELRDILVRLENDSRVEVSRLIFDYSSIILDLINRINY